VYDIKHDGLLADSYVIGTLSGLAQHPETLKKIIHTKEANNEGIFAVDVTVLGLTQTVTVDERLPFDAKDTDVLLFA